MLTLIGLWLMVAVLTEAVTEILKNAFPNLIKDKVTYAVSIGVGVALAYAFTLNPFALTGIAAHVSIILAGVLASRGANYLNGIIKKLGIQK